MDEGDANLELKPEIPLSHPPSSFYIQKCPLFLSSYQLPCFDIAPGFSFKELLALTKRLVLEWRNTSVWFHVYPLNFYCYCCWIVLLLLDCFKILFLIWICHWKVEWGNSNRRESDWPWQNSLYLAWSEGSCPGRWTHCYNVQYPASCLRCCTWWDVLRC